MKALNSQVDQVDLGIQLSHFPLHVCQMFGNSCSRAHYCVENCNKTLSDMI
jgi:hypothetical protein